jgi:hypothetical protein
MTLCHSRHGYEEAVWDQKVETFLRLHEKAFRALEGWDARLVRVYAQDGLVAVHARVGRGRYAPRPGEGTTAVTSSQRAYTSKLLGRCERVGSELHEWAKLALEERGVRAIRLIQGVLGLTRKHPRERVLWAARLGVENRLFRYKDLCRLAQQQANRPTQLSLLEDHPSIRPMTHYRLEDFE